MSAGRSGRLLKFTPVYNNKPDLVKISEKKKLVKITRKVEIVSTKLIGHNLMYLYLNVLIS
jgi:hypothetical protein